MTTDALIGSTGFVGSNLARQARFGDSYHSRNVAAIAGRRFDTLVCAAAPGSMFEANRAPDADLRRIEALCDLLGQTRARRFILISSIAVLADFSGGDDETSTRFQTALAYGRNRRALEIRCLEMFESCLVVRLPALFGPGLKKNFVFDILNPVPTMLTPARYDALLSNLGPTAAATLAEVYAVDPNTGMHRVSRAALHAHPGRNGLVTALHGAGATAVGFHHPDTTYQYYDLSRLWRDIGIAAEAGLGCIHLATEPLPAARIHEALTGRPMPASGAAVHREDMRTRHAALWGREGPYLETGIEVLDRLRRFHADCLAAA